MCECDACPQVRERYICPEATAQWWVGYIYIYDHPQLLLAPQECQREWERSVGRRWGYRNSSDDSADEMPSFLHSIWFTEWFATRSPCHVVYNSHTYCHTCSSMPSMNFYPLSRVHTGIHYYYYHFFFTDVLLATTNMILCFNRMFIEW